MPKKKAKKKTVRKQSSPRLSTLASQWMRRAEIVEEFRHPKTFAGEETSVEIGVPTKVLKALCASVLSQDETRGQKR